MPSNETTPIAYLSYCLSYEGILSVNLYTSLFIIIMVAWKKEKQQVNLQQKAKKRERYRLHNKLNLRRLHATIMDLMTLLTRLY